MTEYTLTINGVEIETREITIKEKVPGLDPLDEREVKIHAKDCVIPSDDVEKLLEALKCGGGTHE